MLALAQCWNLLAGYAGLVSVGQQAFVGLGGYLAVRARACSAASIRCSRFRSPASSPRCVALPTALIVFRLRGAYFAIGTWVVAEVYRLVLAQVKQLGGGTGTSLPPSVDIGRARHRVGQDLVRRAHAGGARHHLPIGWRSLLVAGTLALRLSAAALAARAGARRHPRSTKPRPRASASTSSAPSSASMW